MKPFLVTLGLALLAQAQAAPPTELPPPAPGGHTELSAAARDGAGQLVLAWTQVGRSRTVHAAQWVPPGRGQPGHWRALGGILNEDARFNAAQLRARTDHVGRVWLSWAEDAAEAHVDSWLMAVWDGRGWRRPVSAVRRNLSDAGRSRAFDVLPGGVPTLAWTDIHAPGAWGAAIRPLVWDGQTWRPQAVLSRLSGAGFGPDLRTRRDGRRVLAFLEGDYATMNVVVLAEDPAGHWTRLGGPLNRHAGTFAADLSLRLSPWGRPQIAWAEADPGGGPDQIQVGRWTGTRWAGLGGPLGRGTGHAGHPQLAQTRSGEMRVAWLQDGQPHAARWTGQRWAALALPRMAHATGLSLSNDGSALAVSDGGRLRVWRWD